MTKSELEQSVSEHRSQILEVLLRYATQSYGLTPHRVWDVECIEDIQESKAADSV